MPKMDCDESCCGIQNKLQANEGNRSAFPQTFLFYGEFVLPFFPYTLGNLGEGKDILAEGLNIACFALLASWKLAEAVHLA